MLLMHRKAINKKFTYCFCFHRAFAALRAESLRCFLVSLAALALPPFSRAVRNPEAVPQVALVDTMIQIHRLASLILFLTILRFRK